MIVRPANLSSNSPVRIVDKLDSQSNNRIFHKSVHSRPQNESNRGKNHRLSISQNSRSVAHNNNKHKKPRFSESKRRCSPEPFAARRTVTSTHSNSSSPPVVHVSVDVKRTQSHDKPLVTFESRSTQTDKTGPCKCSRDVSKRNKKRRLNSKRDRELLHELIENSHTD